MRSSKKFYLTNEARESAINEITRQIDVLMSMKTSELGYNDCLSIVKNLCELREAIQIEIENSRLGLKEQGLRASDAYEL